MIYICGIQILNHFEMNEIKTNTVARINNVNILVVENGEKRVAIRPICDALGITMQAQLDRLKEDPILSSTVMPSIMVGADGKEREMQTIPFKYIFGWLFRIDSRNVKEEAKEAVLKYQIECYDALYYHFTAYADFIEKKQIAVEKQLVVYDDAKSGYSTASKTMKEAEKKLKRFRQLSFEDYDAELRQLKMFTDDEMKGVAKDE